MKHTKNTTLILASLFLYQYATCEERPKRRESRSMFFEMRGGKVFLDHKDITKTAHTIGANARFIRPKSRSNPSPGLAFFSSVVGKLWRSLFGLKK